MFLVIAITVFKSSDFYYHEIKTEDISTIFRPLWDGQVKNEVDQFYNAI
jgi:hypothetical protein